MAIKKSDRLKVYDKYNGHCAYCGKDLKDIKNMQIDHIRPKRERIEALAEGENIDDLENLNPSCRRCNHYKRALSIEKFREYIKTLHKRLENNYIVKVAIEYGIVEIRHFDGKFYFEKVRVSDDG